MTSILVIDDDPVIRKFLSGLLSKKHEVHAFESWSSAYASLRENQYQLVLLDVQMPGFQGDDIARLVRRSSDGKVILFSSLEVNELKRRSEDCGADGYVRKNLDPVELKEALSEFIEA